MTGILLVDKPQGFTSHDVVAKLRRLLGERRIGHTGTLDPLATGLLPICIGKATKVCGLLTEGDKAYEAVLLLGRATDSQDISGKILWEREPEGDAEAVLAALSSFVGSYDQVPPMYSALKVGGKKLVDLARAGREVERQPRRVQIYALDILSVDLPRIRFRVRCSKGTYIRTLCHDVGEKLGCGGCLESLRRLESGPFGIEHAHTLEDIEQAMARGGIQDFLMRIDGLFAHVPAFRASEAAEALLRNGNPLPADMLEAMGEPAQDCRTIRVYDAQGCFAALYARTKPQERVYKIEKMFL